MKLTSFRVQEKMVSGSQAEGTSKTSEEEQENEHRSENHEDEQAGAGVSESLQGNQGPVSRALKGRVCNGHYNTGA